MNTQSQLWIYNDISVATLIDREESIFDTGHPQVVVEVAPQSGWVHLYGMEAPGGYPGLCGLLGGQTALEDLLVKPAGSRQPILFAPSSPQSVPAIGSALRRLTDPAIRQFSGAACSVQVLVELSLVRALLPWFGGFDSIGLLWSLDCAPGPLLEETVADLAVEGYLTEEKWAGLIAYTGDSEGLSDRDRQRLQPMLEGVPRSRLLERSLVS